MSILSSSLYDCKSGSIIAVILEMEQISNFLIHLQSSLFSYFMANMFVNFLDVVGEWNQTWSAAFAKFTQLS